MQKEAVGHALHALDSTMRRFVDTYSHKRENEQLTGANVWVIQFIADNRDGPVYMRDVERHFGITRSTASKVVDMLVRKGFVERHTGETDARLRRLTLTPQAEAMLQTIREDHEMLESVLLRGFTANERETLLTYLHRMKENVDYFSMQRQNHDKQKNERSGAVG
ncbi:MAG: MarR family winged helix-turn-helix transcriptional regulator [Hominenteromicrobium sp.]